MTEACSKALVAALLAGTAHFWQDLLPAAKNHTP